MFLKDIENKRMNVMMGSSFQITGELHRGKALLMCNNHSSLTSQQVWRNIHIDTQPIYFHIDTQAIYFAATGKRV